MKLSCFRLGNLYKILPNIRKNFAENTFAQKLEMRSSPGTLSKSPL